MLSRIIQFLLLLVLSLCTITKGMRPSITPDTDELHLKEGDALEIICTHFTKLYFFYPQDVINEIKTSTPLMEEREINGIHETVFRRSSTVRGDTGFYGCADHDVQVNMKSYDDPEIAWIYVYVKSNATAFVQTTTDAISLREVSGETIFITCRPNSPNYKIYLDNDEQNIEEIADRLTYNPRFGFALGNLTVTDSMFYYCKCNETDPNDEITYILHITKKHILNKPIIMEENLRHVVSGQELHVNCSVDVAKGVDYIVNWTLPFQWKKENGGNKDGRIYTKFHDNGISELIIRNVTEQDEGDYYCNLVTHYDMKRTKIYLTVHNPNIKYINLTSHTSDPVYHRKYGDNVQWIVLIDGYPQPKIRWINPKGDEIIATWKDPDRTKYAVEITNTKTVLKINRLIVEDMGIYTLQAMNEERIETLNFTLEVAGKPVVVVDSVKPYYNWNKTAYYHSQIIGFPPPNVTWTYLSCPNYPLKDTCSENTLQNTKVIPVKETEFSSTARMNMEMSGLITCKACNAFGCDMALEVILVSDVDKGFGIIEPRDAVTEGDDIVLTCAASVYNFTDNLVWMYDDEKPILQSERIKIKKNETPFSYRSNLEIKDVKQSNSGLYLCDSMNKEDQSFSERVQYNLTVHRPRAPEINSNMNGTEITFNLDTESQNTVKLSCAIIQGMPKPNITWYKDDKELQKHEQYLFLRHNQDLWIKYLLERDSGKYSCRASNRIGTAESYQIITVKGRGIPFYVIIAFLVLVIVTVVIVAFFGMKFRRERVMRKQLMEAGLMHFEEGALECLNPELTVDDQAELLPYDRKWEFPREKLKLGKQLGSGAFGVVMKAEAQGICEEEAVTTVAVKMVRRTTEATYIRALASELKIMVHLGKHLNVVNLLGACTKNISKRELLVIVEYCRFGNLHNYLLRHRSNFINQIDPATGRLDLEIGRDLMRSPSICSNRIKYAALSFSRSISANSDNSTTGPETVAYYHRQGPDSGSVTLAPDGCVLSNSSVQPGWRSNYRGDYKDHNLKPICTQDLLSWAFQVARGMEYLSNRRVLHGDLAARNILLAENNIVKICDFGLAKTMYKDDNYKKKGDAPLPVKWMAIESIRDRVFSTQSDIWSFGIVLWEFFTLAETPYPGMEAEKQYQKLIEGYRLEQPEYATKEVYDIMLQCWKAKATLRPSFADLVDGIGELLEESVKMHYVDLNEPYLDMNTRNLETGKNDYLTMMSAPDHTALSSPTGDYVNSPLSMTQNENDSTYLCMSPDGKNGDESGIFSPRPNSEKSKFEFPSTLSDSDGDSTVELSPMLKKSDEEDPYLKPINVNARRAEFVRKREEASKNNKMTERPVERDSGYCNTLKNLHLIDLNTHSHNLDDTDSVRSSKNNADYVPSIIRTPDNYVNMPKQKSDLLKDMSNVPTGFSNPSYIMMNNNESAEPSV